MSTLPDRPSLDHLRKQAKVRRRSLGVPLHRAQFELAREYGFDSWPKLVHHVEASGLTGLERALVLADVPALSGSPDLLSPIDGLPPLLFLLRRSTGAPSDVRAATGVLLEAGADPDSFTAEDGGWRRTALYDAVERADLALARLLLDRGATSDEDAFYHACERGGTAFLDLLHRAGLENATNMVNHKLDFEDVEGLRWFLDKGVDVNEHYCLHHAIVRSRGMPIIELLLSAGADVNKPWDRWDIGRRPLALAAKCGHLAAYERLAELGATAELDPVDLAMLAIARGESAEVPDALSPSLGHPRNQGWVLGAFCVLGRTDVVRNLLDSGMGVDTRGWSNFTPIDQAAMHGRTETVRLLIERGADLTDCAFDDEGPTPLDCAIWGIRNNPAADGDYPGTVQALLAAGAPTRHRPPTGNAQVDALLT